MHVTEYSAIVGFLWAIEEKLVPINRDIRFKLAEVSLDANDTKAYSALGELFLQHTQLTEEKNALEHKLRRALAEGVTKEPLPEFRALPLQEGDQN